MNQLMQLFFTDRTFSGLVGLRSNFAIKKTQKKFWIPRREKFFCRRSWRKLKPISGTKFSQPSMASLLSIELSIGKKDTTSTSSLPYQSSSENSSYNTPYSISSFGNGEESSTKSSSGGGWRYYLGLGSRSGSSTNKEENPSSTEKATNPSERVPIRDASCNYRRYT